MSSAIDSDTDGVAGAAAVTAKPEGVFTADDVDRLERLAQQRVELDERAADLERETRDAVRDVRAKGMTPTQIAEIFDVSRQTVHNWLGRS
jgi:DNA-directed RNA polymerase specialized sigma24 family protein